MEKNGFVVPLKEACTGELHGGNGVFRILVDSGSCGAKHFSLLVNTSRAGTRGKAHAHDVEHCWYILSGRGVVHFEGGSFPISPETAVYTPAGVLHSVDVDAGSDLTYVVVYAPPGPERLLKERGAAAFDDRKE